jgi:hypothetical protein
MIGIGSTIGTFRYRSRWPWALLSSMNWSKPIGSGPYLKIGASKRRMRSADDDDDDG